eukprot:203027_1
MATQNTFPIKSKKTNKTEPTIQIVSDLHLEFGGVLDKMETEDRFPKRGAPILALLGDIGNPHQDTYWQFIDKMCDRFDYIIIIAGNHEYYKAEYHSVHHLINSTIESNIKYKDKVYFLQNQVLELPDVLPNIRILGTTMWVNYPKANEDKNIAIQYEYKINDFRRIQFNDDNKEEKESKIPLLTSINVNRFHDEAVQFLQAELNRAMEDDKQAIILTHHAPTNYKSVHPATDHETNPLGYGMNYASMEYLFKPPLLGWFFGHTHCCCDFILKHLKSKDEDWTVRIAANQQGYIMGYGKEYAPKEYSNEKVIVFPNGHEQNENVPVIEFKDVEKHLVDKNQLIPDPSFLNNVADSGDVNKNEHKSFCYIL